jgi:hypothetical protein
VLVVEGVDAQPGGDEDETHHRCRHRHEPSVAQREKLQHRQGGDRNQDRDEQRTTGESQPEGEYQVDQRHQ